MSEAILLSRLERLMLSNQFKMLAELDPHERDYYDRVREALDRGFVLAYQDAFNQICEGPDALSLASCRLVIDAFSLYDALQRSYEALDDKQGLKASDVAFPGFDGNNETPFMSYATFVREREDRFTNVIVNADGMNSHMPMVQRYSQMIALWQGEMESSYELTREQIDRLLSPEQWPPIL